MTALMEMDLDKIDAGTLTLDEYMRKQEDFVKISLHWKVNLPKYLPKATILSALFAAAVNFIYMTANLENFGHAVIIKMDVKQFLKIVKAFPL